MNIEQKNYFALQPNKSLPTIDIIYQQKCCSDITLQFLMLQSV